MALVETEPYLRLRAAGASHEAAEAASRVPRGSAGSTAPGGDDVTGALVRSMKQLKWMTALLLALTSLLFVKVVVMSWTL